MWFKRLNATCGRASTATRVASAAKGARRIRPGTKAARDHIGDYLADILFLRRIVIGTGMVARRRQGPTAFLLFQIPEVAGGVVDIGMRVEHLGHRREVAAVIMMVDLHAADIDQLHAPPLRVGELLE